MRFRGLFGFIFLLGIAFALSSNRKVIHRRTVFWGVSLQILFALMVLKGEWISSQLAWIPGGGVVYSLLLLILFCLFYFLRREQPPRQKSWNRYLGWMISAVAFLCLLKFNLVALVNGLLGAVHSGLISWTGQFPFVLQRRGFAVNLALIVDFQAKLFGRG